MAIFVSNPHGIFPFPVSGCSGLKQGAVCGLTAPIGIDTHGIVSVSANSTAVRFTVMNTDYFAPKGSTITFSTFARGGRLYFKQSGRTGRANFVAGIGVGVLGLDEPTWDRQAANFRRYLRHARRA